MLERHKQLMEALTLLEKGFREVNTAWDRLVSEGDYILSNSSEYPFNSNFEEVKDQVSTWIDEVQSNILFMEEDS